jgi:serine/threonine protein kinase
MNKIRHINVLGSGSFGNVIQSIYTDNNIDTTYAIKVLAKAKVKNIEHLMEEVDILRLLKHPFIIKLAGTFQTAHQLCMVFEPLMCGDLCTLLYYNDELPKLPFDLIMFYLSTIVIALDYCHNKGVIYRDLKPENIMVDEKGYLKLVDMGLAKRIRHVNEYTTENGEVIRQMVDEKTYTLCGTPEYLSPEILMNLGYDKSTDIWSLGVLLYEFFMKEMPFYGGDNSILETNINLLFTNIVKTMRKEFVLKDEAKLMIQNEHMENLIVGLLAGKRENRIGVKEGTISIFNHELFANYKDTINSITNLTYIPPYIPKRMDDDMYEPISSIPNVQLYKGDNSRFADF